MSERSIEGRGRGRSNRLRRCFMFEAIESRCFLSTSALGYQLSQLDSSEAAASVQTDAAVSDTSSAAPAQDSTSSSRGSGSTTTQGDGEDLTSSPSTQSAVSTSAQVTSDDSTTDSTTSATVGGAKRAAPSPSVSLQSAPSTLNSESDRTDTADGAPTEDATPTAANGNAAPFSSTSSSTRTRQTADGSSSSDTSVTGTRGPSQQGDAAAANNDATGIAQDANAKGAPSAPAADELVSEDVAGATATSTPAPVQAQIGALASIPAIAVNIGANAASKSLKDLLPSVSRLFSKLQIFVEQSDLAVRAVGSLTQSYRITSVASALSAAGPQATLFSTQQIYHFARMGNPIALLNDSVASFVNELAGTPGSSRNGSQHKMSRAWLITAVVVAADSAAFLYLRKQSRAAARETLAR